MKTTFQAPIKTIDLGHVRINVLSATSFEIDDSPEGMNEPFFKETYEAPTANLDTIIAILRNPLWKEDHITAAVAALNSDPEQEEDDRQAESDRRHRASFHWDERDCGGVFDGNGVVSDADPGL